MVRALFAKYAIFGMLLCATGSVSAVEIASCNDGKNLLCPKTGNFGTYYDCLNRKKTLLDSCLSGMKLQIKNSQDKITAKVDAAARAENQNLDQAQNTLQYHLGAIEQINQDNSLRFETLRTRFASFTSEFEKDFKPNVAAYQAEYAQFAKDINAVIDANRYEDRPELQRIEVRLDNAYTNHMTQVITMRSKIILIREEFKFFTEDYRNRVIPHSSYLAQHGYQGLIFDLSQYLDLLLRGDQNVIQAADVLSNARDTLRARIDTTTRDLIDQYVLNKTKKIIDDTNHMLAATAFLKQVNDSIKKAFVDFKSQSIQGVPLFSDRYKAMLNFIEFAKICESSSQSPWMKPGCSFATEKLISARSTLKQMPSNMQLGMMLIAAKAGASRKQSLDQVKILITQQNIGQAVLVYDQLAKEVFQ